MDFLLTEEGTDALWYKNFQKPCKRSDEQKDELRELLSQGQSISDTGNVWTLQRIVDLIQPKFGIKYWLASVSGIMKKIGWTCQKPVVRAMQRDEEARENGSLWNGLKYKSPWWWTYDSVTLICANRFLSSMIFKWRMDTGAESAAGTPHCNNTASNLIWQWLHFDGGSLVR